MAPALRVSIFVAILSFLPAAAGAVVSTQIVSSAETRTVELGSTPHLAANFDLYLKDPVNGSSLRFDSLNGAYVVCGGDGTFEQGVGTVTHSGSVITLSHTFANKAFNGLESVHATVDTATGQGQAYLNASSESMPSFKPVSIDDLNINDNGAPTCLYSTAVNEGTINLTDLPDHAFSLNTSQTRFDVLQKYSLNTDFGGNLTRLVGGISRNGAGPLSFQIVIYNDAGNKPASAPIYVSPTFQYPSFPAFPAIGIVHQNLSLKVEATYWAGFRLDPTTNPAYFPFDSAATSPDTDVYGCGETGSCEKITLGGSVPLRNLYLSANYKYPSSHESGGFVRYSIPGTTDLFSDKCDGYYEQINLTTNRVYQLYAENGEPSSSEFPPTSYSSSFARIRPVLDVGGTGLDGKADTRYNSTRISAFSFIGNNKWNFCTKPSTATDYECHTIPSFQVGTGGYTRIAGVNSGYEASYGNSVGDQIDRAYLQYNGSSWTSQALNPVRSTPSIGTPEFGFNWYQAKPFNLGVVYEYKKTSGAIEAQVLNGNTIVGTYAIDNDDPPPGFQPSYATRMGETARGWGGALSAGMTSTLRATPWI